MQKALTKKFQLENVAVNYIKEEIKSVVYQNSKVESVRILDDLFFKNKKSIEKTLLNVLLNY